MGGGESGRFSAASAAAIPPPLFLRIGDTFEEEPIPVLFRL